MARTRIIRLTFWLCLALLGGACGLLARETDDDTNWQHAIRKANAPLIVFIRTEVRHRNGSNVTSVFTTGTGFIVHPDGWVLTCSHVIPKVDGDELILTASVGGRDEHSYTCNNKKIIREGDGTIDLALFRLPENGVGSWRAAKSIATAAIDSEILALGFPQGQGLIPKSGRISNNNSRSGIGWITDAPLNPGMSGGPVFDPAGAVVAVVAAGFPGEQGLNELIPISFAKGLLQKVNSPLIEEAARPDPPTVTSERVETVAGESFDYTIGATGSPREYRATGLPSGLTLDRESGEITGDIDEDSKSVYYVQLSARNDSGWGKGKLTIRVRHGDPSPPPSPTPEPSQLGQFIFQNNAFFVQGTSIFAQNGMIVGQIGPPQMLGSAYTLHWANGTASHFMANRTIINLYPNGSMVVGQW